MHDAHSVKQMKVLLTGGAGYIGSHISKALLEAGRRVAVIDNLTTGSPQVVSKLAIKYNRDFRFFRADVRNPDQLDNVFARFDPDTVIHLAGLKNVGESFQTPHAYYITNVQGTANLLTAAAKWNCNRLIYSSSAAVYGMPKRWPTHEDHVLNPVSPYGKTKLLGEELVRQWSFGVPEQRRSVILRYFNPCGHDPMFACQQHAARDTGNSLADAVTAVAAGSKSRLEIFGSDYPTPDGTCRRDFVHIDDIADAHVRATAFARSQSVPFVTFNLGSGSDTSILEFLDSYRKATGIRIPHIFCPPRKGDLPVSCADISRAHLHMKWRPMHDIVGICRALQLDPVSRVPGPYLGASREIPAVSTVQQAMRR